MGFKWQRISTKLFLHNCFIFSMHAPWIPVKNLFIRVWWLFVVINTLKYCKYSHYVANNGLNSVWLHLRRKHASTTAGAAASRPSVATDSRRLFNINMDLPEPIRRRLGDFSRTVFVDQSRTQPSPGEHANFLGEGQCSVFTLFGAASCWANSAA